MIAFFYLLKVITLYCSASSLRFSAALLIANIYGTGLAVVLATQDPELAKLGFVFVYISPVIARVFFSTRLALILMCVNTIPFLFLLMGVTFPHSIDLKIQLPDASKYSGAIPCILKAGGKRSGRSKATILNIYELPVPTPIRLNIFK